MIFPLLSFKVVKTVMEFFRLGFLLVLSSATLALASRAFRSLEGAAANRSGSGYLSVADFEHALHPGKLMMRSDLFLDDDGSDLVEQLRFRLGSDVTRKHAVSHFLRYNKPEVSTAISDIASVINEVEFLLVASRTASRALKPMLRPLQDVIISFITGRSSRTCLYDYLPIGLRTSDGYHSIFTAIDQETYRILPGELPGILLTLPDEHSRVAQGAGGDSLADEDHKIIKIRLESNRERLIDRFAKSAVDVNPKFSRTFFAAELRLLIAVEFYTQDLLIWREDSREPRRFETGAVIETMEVSVAGDICVSICTVGGGTIRFRLPSDNTQPLVPEITSEVRGAPWVGTFQIRESAGLVIFTNQAGLHLSYFRRVVDEYEQLIALVIYRRFREQRRQLSRSQAAVFELSRFVREGRHTDAWRMILQLGSTDRSRLQRFLEILN